MVYTPGLVRHFGMIAGGTGITPMLQIIRAIVRGRPRNGGKDTTQVDLIFANVNLEDILLKDDLDKLAAEDDGFRMYYVLNNPPEKWDGGVGFCTPDMIKVNLSFSFPLFLRLSFYFSPSVREKDVSKAAKANNPLLQPPQTHLPPPAQDIKILICGPPPMVSAMKKATEGLGYEKPRAVSKLADQVFCF